MDARNKLTEHLTKIISKNIKFHFDVDIDVAHVIRNIPAVRILTYTDVSFGDCDCLKYFNDES